MFRHGRWLATAFGGAIFAFHAVALSAQAIRGGTIREGTLTFDGHATVGNFVGTTHTVRGMHTAAERLADVSGWVEAPVSTLRTGNDHRDRDLNKSMESGKFPAIRFDLARIIPDESLAESTPGTDIGAMLRGTLTLHGVRRDVAIPARIRFDPAAVHVRGDFPLNLKDYGIRGLSKLLGVLKMDEHTVVHLDLTFAEAARP